MRRRRFKLFNSLTKHLGNYLLIDCDTYANHLYFK